MLYSHPLPMHEYAVWEVTWSEPPVLTRLLGLLVDTTPEHAFLVAHKEFWANAGRILIMEHHG